MQVGVDDEDEGGDKASQKKKDKHPATLLHTFLLWAMSSHWVNAVMIVVSAWY